EGASEEELERDVSRLAAQWEDIRTKTASTSTTSPALLYGEPDLAIRVVRDIFNEDFASLVVSGDAAWQEVGDYVQAVAPDLAERLTQWTSGEDLFSHHRVDEQIAKAMDRKVWLPSGGSLVIDRTEAMTVIDVNTGKFVGSGGNLEETVTKNNIEAAEEIVRQLRLRDIGGIIVVDFIDMVLESNRDLVIRRLLECLGRDRTKHQVAEVTSLGLVQMTRKRVGSGLIEVFSEPCEQCGGRGILVHADPVGRPSGDAGGPSNGGRGPRARRGRPVDTPPSRPTDEARPSGPTPAQIAAAAHAAAVKRVSVEPVEDDVAELEVAVADGVTPGTTDGVTVGSLDGTTAQTTVPAYGEDRPHDERPDEQPAAEPAAPTVAEPAAPPPVRARRKRGRVVAPAGPPRPVTDADATAPAETDATAPAETPSGDLESAPQDR
ncbi:MAG TPA: ribonuclease E/G, partial [Dermatophilaceae bacterium]|nr:ribonuclease E/G [Dermatophilaceae bacterium]